MEYNPQAVFSVAHVAAMLRSVSELRKMQEALRSLRLHPYIFGGAIRDLFAFGKTTGDYDVVVVPEPLGAPDISAFEAAVRSCAQGMGFDVAAYPGKQIACSHPASGVAFDVHYPSREVSDKLFRSDLTVNGIGFDCASDALVDPLGGVADLRQGRLRIHSPEFVITNAPNFPRIFRTACKLGLPIEGATLDILQRYGLLLTLHDGKTNVRTALELLKFLSMRNAGKYLRQFGDLKFVYYIFPELSPLEFLDCAGENALNRNIELAAKLDEKIFPPEWESFLDSAAGRSITVRGYLRFALLFDRMGQSYAHEGKNSPFSKLVSGGDEKVFAARMQENLTKHAAARFRELPELSRMVRETLLLFTLSDTFLSASKDSAVSQARGASARHSAALTNQALILSALRGNGTFVVPRSLN